MTKKPVSPIELTVGWLPKGTDAVTLWPFIVYRQGYESNVPLRAHEMYHWRQALRWGVVPWYVAYLVLAPFFLRKPWRHPMEVRAYEVQREVMEAQKETPNAKCMNLKNINQAE